MPIDAVRAKSLFLAASDIVDAGERSVFLERECAGDSELKARVEALLRANDAAPLPAPVSEVATGMHGSNGPVPSEKHSDPTATVGSTLAGKYILVEPIGEGGMGSVWRAKQSEPVKRFVAIKLIKAGMDSKQVLARFEAERQALALMDHPNIAKVLDGGLHGHLPYFVMELVKGVPITEYCDARKLTPKERLQLFVPVCQAIQHAHQKGIIHRDIKPSNVLIALYDDKPVVKVIDFGVAKATGGTLTERTIDTGFGGVVGTPQYMSPEQATFNNLDIDTRSDVYALGVLLYELLTGSPPFSKKDLEQKGLLEMLRVVREEEPPRPSTKLSTADALPTLSANRGTEPKKLTGLLRNELDWIVMKALEKERTRRYETANGFAADISRYLTGEAVQAHPPSAGYRLRKFVRRNKGQVLAASLVLFALLAGITGTTWGLIRAEEGRQAETEQRQIADAKQREAEAERAAALAAQAKAMAALRSATDDVVEKLIGSKEKYGPKEQAYLESALRRWQEFADVSGDSERARSMRAEGEVQVAKLQSRLGEREKAGAGYRRALALYEKLALDFPAVHEYRYEQVDLLLFVGLRAFGGDTKTGTERRLRRHEILLDLTVEFPKVAKYWEKLADSYRYNLHDAERDRTDPDWGNREAIKIYQRLVEDYPTEPRYRLEHADLVRNWALELRNRGDWPGAEEKLRSAILILERLRESAPKNPECRRKLALAHHLLWYQLIRSEPRDAEDHRRKTIALREGLAAEFRDEFGDQSELERAVAEHQGRNTRAMDEGSIRKRLADDEKSANEFPAIPKHHRFRVGDHHELGELLNDLERYEEAKEQHERGLALQEKFQSAFPNEFFSLHYTAKGELGLGRAYGGLRKRTEAELHFQRALAIREKIAKDTPDVFATTELGGTYMACGKIVLDIGDPSGSLAWYGKAIATLESPLRTSSEQDLSRVREQLGMAYWHRAVAYYRLDKFPESGKDYDRVVEFSPRWRQAWARAARANVRVHNGLVTEGLAEIADVLKSANPELPFYTCAGTYSFASTKVPEKKQEYIDLAMELLHKAVQTGYKDTAFMKKDADLDPLRGREDFKRLLADLEKKVEKK